MHNTEQYDHRWGYKDSMFEVKPNRSVVFTGGRYELSGYEIPGLLPFIEEIFDIKLDIDAPNNEVSDKPVEPAQTNSEFLKEIEEFLTPDQITVDDRERLIHSHGQTTADEIYQVLYDKIARICDLVVFVKTPEQVQKLVKACVKHNICLVPYGGGTSVSCALKLPADEKRMILVCNTRDLNEIEWVDTENSKACVQAGITGSELEEKLKGHGFTCGHEPDSMEFSTLGGWIATNASGMKKNRYGNIEQVVESVTMVTPTGELSQIESQARVSVGVQPKHLSFGSEGNLGLITKAVINIHKLPEVVKYDSLVFKDFETGVAYLKKVSDNKVLPASIRLVDNIQFRSGQALKPRLDPVEKLTGRVQKLFLTKIKKFDPYKMVAATVTFEGTEDEVIFQNRQIKKIAEDFGAVVGGEANGKRGYMLTYAIAYIRDFLSKYDVIGETYETTVPWDRIHDVCDAVAAKADELHKHYGLEGKPYVSPRVTQTYNTGVCIYFTHGFCSRGVENPGQVFGEIEKVLRKTIMDNGGSLSHHHGIGKLRKDFMDQVISEDSINLLKEIKKTVDPNNTFGISNNVM